MSPREELANRIADWLDARTNVFSAPYGVIRGLHTPENGRGKARILTFGIAARLDATLMIWSATRMDFRSTRDEQTFRSEVEFYDYCVKTFGVPR